MKVAHIVGRIDIEASGPTYSVSSLCQALAERGLDVALHAMGIPPAVASSSYATYVHPRWAFPERLWISPPLRRALFQAAKQCDILHNNGLWIVGNMYPAAAVVGTRCRLVTSPRGTLADYSWGRSRWLKKAMWALGQSRTVEHAACLHATAESEYLQFRKLALRPPVAIIPNGVTIPDASAPHDPHKPMRRLLFLGRIHPVKGVDLLIQAWKKVQQDFPAWELQIAGPDNEGYLPRMCNLSQSLRVERLSFCGAVYGREKSECYRSADLFVLPSHSENFGLSVAEALAHGVPAIVTHGAPWQGLQDRQCGWWIKQDVESLADCLRHTLAQSPDHLRACGLRGRQWMESDFSWQRIGQMMHETYQWLLGGGAPPDWVRLK